MSDPFNNLESRYLAFKWRDIEQYLSDAEQRTLTTIAGKVLAARVSAGRGELLCLCIEHDWPEFPPALNALTTRLDKEAGIQPDIRNRPAIPRRMSVWINHLHYLCPYCKRNFPRSVRHDPAIKAAASRHVHACYERRLFAAGYVLLANRIAPAAEASQKMLARLRKSARKAS